MIRPPKASAAHLIGYAFRIGTLAFAFAGQTAQAGPVATEHVAVVNVSEPAGFSQLAGPQRAVVDVFFGGRRLGEAEISFQPGSLKFLAPEKLVALLPDIADTAAIRAALSEAELPAHASLICPPSADPAKCGRLTPAVAGVIFDQDRFRVEVFVNPHLLAVNVSVRQEYLPAPEGGLSIINAISTVLSGSSKGAKLYNLQDRFIMGDKDRRLRADLSYASGFGIQADRLVAEMDKPGWRYSAGVVWAPGTSLIGRRKVVGLGIETQIDTRLDKDVMRGNPLIVFLNQRARVDILRDGRVQASRIYDAGNQSLDTSALPDGSYDVVLRIEEASGARHEEHRFFTKNSRIAAVGQKVMFAYAGVLANDARRGFISPTGTPFLQAGMARRLSPHVALDGTVLMTNRTAMAEAGAYYIASQAQFRLAALGSSNGAFGALVQVSSQGNSRFNFNFDLRHIKTSEQQTFSGSTAGPPGPFSPLNPFGADPAALPLAKNSYTQISGNISYSLPGAQLGLSASYRREKGEQAKYSIGPSLRWNFLRRGQLHGTFLADAVVSDQGHSGFVGVSLQLLAGRASLGSTAGIRSTSLDGEPHRSGPVGGIQGSWQDDNVAGAELSLGGAYERALDREQVSATANLRGRKARLSADVIKGYGHDAGPTQYSLGFQTTVAIRGGAIAFEGRYENDSMVLVKVDGARPDAQFEVLVNDSAVGTAHSGGKLAVALPPYRQYDVRVRPTGGDLLQFDGSSRRVGLYPGNVAQLAWIAKPITAMFGRLVFEDGTPVSAASVTAPGGISETDENGYFQIESTDDSDLDVHAPDGRSCRVPLPGITHATGYAPLGTLICRSAPPEFRLTSAEPT